MCKDILAKEFVETFVKKELTDEEIMKDISLGKHISSLLKK